MEPNQLFADVDPAQYAGLAGVAVIVALTNVTKRVVTNENLFPVISIILGIVWNVMLAFGFNGDYKRAIIAGVISGISASGMYGMVSSSTKKDVKDGKVAGMMATPAAKVVKPVPPVVVPPVVAPPAPPPVVVP